MTLTFEDIEAAARRIAPVAVRTPMMRSSTLNQQMGGQIYFKCENLQKIGAFKIRGAMNAVMSLDNGCAAHGVGTHSSGNHGAALSLAAGHRGIPAYIVMPENASQAKQYAVRGYCGNIIHCQPG